jgi:tetratricopeptide (TPR) repeat protein
MMDKRLSILPIVSSLVAAFFILSAWNRSATSLERLRISAANYSNDKQRVGRLLETMSRRNPRDLEVKSAIILNDARPLSRDWLHQAINGSSTAEAGGIGDIEKRYEAIVKLDPLEDACWHNLAWVYASQGEMSLAREAARRATIIAPEDPVYRVSLGLISEHEDPKFAVVQYATGVALKPLLLHSSFYYDLMGRNPELANQILGAAKSQLALASHDPIQEARLASILMFEGGHSVPRSLLLDSLSQLSNLGMAWHNLASIESADNNTIGAALDEARSEYLLHNPTTRSAPVEHIFRARSRVLYSPHSRRVASEYKEVSIFADDLLPAGLLDYLAPILSGPVN